MDQRESEQDREGRDERSNDNGVATSALNALTVSLDAPRGHVPVAVALSKDSPARYSFPRKRGSELCGLGRWQLQGGATRHPGDPNEFLNQSVGGGMRGSSLISRPSDDPPPPLLPRRLCCPAPFFTTSLGRPLPPSKRTFLPHRIQKRPAVVPALMTPGLLPASRF